MKHTVIAGVIAATVILVEPTVWEMLDPHATTLVVAPGPWHIWMALVGVPGGLAALRLGSGVFGCSPDRIASVGSPRRGAAAVRTPSHRRDIASRPGRGDLVTDPHLEEQHPRAHRRRPRSRHRGLQSRPGHARGG